MPGNREFATHNLEIIGDRKTVEPSIRALNLGSIKALTVDEVFAAAK